MRKEFLIVSLGWGVGLWLFGYILGILLFPIVPQAFLGWVIMPIGLAATVWVLWKRVKGKSFLYYFLLGLIWTVIAVVFDYFFLVKVFKPADGYYKLDVYVYYGLTFVLPMIMGWRKNK
jgi:hypothetical protein